jgi:hypothetical protein
MADVRSMKKIPFFLVIVLFSCESALQQHETSITGKVAKNNLIEFKVNGQQVRTSGWNISRLTWSQGEKQWLNITTNMNEDKRTIMANLDGIAPGTYSFNENSSIKTSHADFKPDYRGDMLKSFAFMSGAFQLTEVDTVRNIVNGSFSGKAKDIQGNIVDITEGKIINCKLKPDVIRY